jgi:hypothetical protein
MEGHGDMVGHADMVNCLPKQFKPGPSLIAQSPDRLRWPTRGADCGDKAHGSDSP